MKVKVTQHALERFRERIYERGSITYIKTMVENALAKGYPVEGDRITFGVVTFVVVYTRTTRLLVLTCWHADKPVTPDQLIAERQRACSELPSV